MVTWEHLATHRSRAPHVQYQVYVAASKETGPSITYHPCHQDQCVDQDMSTKHSNKLQVLL